VTEVRIEWEPVGSGWVGEWVNSVGDRGGLFIVAPVGLHRYVWQNEFAIGSSVDPDLATVACERTWYAMACAMHNDVHPPDEFVWNPATDEEIKHATGFEEWNHPSLSNRGWGVPRDERCQ
jgi:hypothetical protein